MKMRPKVNLDEFVNRSVQTTQNIGHLSRFHEEQIFDARNPQMECKAHLSQNVAHSSTYGSNVTPQNWHVTNHKWHAECSNAEENQRNRNPGKIEQNHKGVDTHDVDSSCRYQSEISDEKITYSSCCFKLYLWCAKLCHRKKKCSKNVLGKSRRLCQRIKKRRKKCEKPNQTTIIDTSTYREPISPSIAKLKKNDNQELVKVINDTVCDDRKEKEKKRERRKKEKDRRERKEKMEKVKRRKHEEEILYARDEDCIVRNHVIFKKPLLLPPLPTDFTKSCCYLCTQNTLAIAAAITRPEQFDKSVQVSTHKLCVTMSPELDKSCSPLLVRTSIKVKTRETSTLCPSINETRPKEMRMKKRKFGMFPGLMRTICPAGRHAACETDKMILRCNDNAEKREPRNEKCCRRKNI